MKKVFTNLEKKIDEAGDKILERWSEEASEKEFEKIETALLEFKWKLEKILDKEL